MTKLCVDCKHYVLNSARFAEPHRCKRNVREVLDIVTGEPHISDSKNCYMERQMIDKSLDSNNWDVCSYEGVYFEPKDK